MAKETKEPITQEHMLKDGKSVNITQFTRKIGNNEVHKYMVTYPDVGDGWDATYSGAELSSVTALNTHTAGDTFGIAVSWATKLIRNSKPTNFNAANDDAAKSIAEGNSLHECIERYIKSRGKDIDEENDMFTLWLKDVGSKHDWAASEVFLYHPVLNYGGTADAISVDPKTMEPVIWDWKTKNRETYEKYGPVLYYKDHAQLAAYANALDNMGSIYTPTKGNIVYIMRDGSYADVVPVDLQLSTEIFGLSARMAHLVGQLTGSIKGAK